MNFDGKLLKFFTVLILLPLLILPAFGQEQPQQIKLTSGGTINVGFSTDPQNLNPGDQTQLKISFINKQTKEIQQHIDYRVTLTNGQNQVFGIPLTHTAEGAVSIPYQFQDAGNYQATVSVEGILFQPITPETAVFSFTVGNTQPVPQTPEFGPLAGLVITISIIGTLVFSRRFVKND